MESGGKVVKVHEDRFRVDYDRTQDRNRYMVMLPSHERTHALVEVLPDRSIRLPMAPTSYYYHRQMNVADLEESISSMFGVKVRYVRELWATPEEGKYNLWGETFNLIVVILVEWVGDETGIEARGEIKWMSRSELNGGNWVETDKELGLDLKEAVLRGMKEVSGEVEVRRPPWRHMGWFTEILGWVKELSKWEISDHDLYGMFVKSVDCQHSAVWRCDLDLSNSNHMSTVVGEEESVYIKAAVPLFAEARRTATIAKVLEPLKIVPDVLGIREHDCVLMLRDTGSVTDDGEVDIKLLVETVVSMQNMSAEHLDELKAGGLEVRDSEWLLSNIHRILCHDSLDKAVADNEENAKMLRDIRCREEEVRDACRKISMYAIPNTLVHGDLTEFNVGSRETLGGRGYQFFDWGRSHIGHPLVDTEQVAGFFSEDESTKKLWNQEFRKHWKSVGSEEEFAKLGCLVPILNNCADLDMFLQESEVNAHEWYGIKEFIVNHIDFVHTNLNRIKRLESPNRDS